MPGPLPLRGLQAVHQTRFPALDDDKVSVSMSSSSLSSASASPSSASSSSSSSSLSSSSPLSERNPTMFVQKHPRRDLYKLMQEAVARESQPATKPAHDGHDRQKIDHLDTGNHRLNDLNKGSSKQSNALMHEGNNLDKGSLKLGSSAKGVVRPNHLTALASTQSMLSENVWEPHMQEQMRKCPTSIQANQISDDQFVCLEVAGRGAQWKYTLKQQPGKKGGSVFNIVDMKLEQNPLGDLMAFVRSCVVPEGFPDSVAPSYTPYMRWRALKYLFGGAMSVFTTRSLLHAVGISRHGSASTAMAVNWVIKDGAGRVGKLLFARHGKKFDYDMKQLRFTGDLLMELGAAVELATVAAPQLFLPLACAANIAKNVAAVASTSTRAPIYKAFARGDVTAKGECISNIADLLGTGLGIFISKKNPSLMATFAVLSCGYLCCSYNEIKSVGLPTLNRARFKVAVQFFLETERPASYQKAGASGDGPFVSVATARSPSGLSKESGVRSQNGVIVKRLEQSYGASVRRDGSIAEARAEARAVDAAVYDPLQLAERYKWRPFTVLGRTLRIVLSLGSFGLGLLIDQKRGQIDQNKRKRAAEFRRRLTNLGPTFVKVGQGLSTRPDLCPPEYLDELATLQDALPTFPDAEAFACIERELGVPLESIFLSITASPVAAASLGQVYKARLRSSGETVAVKVQRPAIEEAVGLDFFLLRSLCHFINKNVDIVTSDAVALMDEFARRVYQELNYVQEGKNAIRFRKLYGDRPDVYVPGVFWDYTSVKVLTMEWVEGTKLSEQAIIEKKGLNLLKLVNTGIQCSLRQLLEHGYFHADPHPGNLLAMNDGKLAFLDFGMMSETPQEARFAIIGHVVHMVNRDYEAMARDYYALDFISPEIDTSPIAPALKEFFDDALNATVSELNFKTIVNGLGAVLYQYPFDVPAYYALILRSLTVLEGLALYTDPNFKVLGAAYPYFAKRLLTDPNPYLRDALIELLFKDGKFRWNRLENLLVQGKKDSDFSTKDALQPVLKLLLGTEGKELRTLVVKEAVRVSEAMVIGTALAGYNAVPQPIKNIFANGNDGGPLRIKESDLNAMLNLREQILRIWNLLRTSEGFDPAVLQPVLQVLQQPEAQAIGGQVLGGVSQRLAARLLQQVLRPAGAPLSV